MKPRIDTAGLVAQEDHFLIGREENRPDKLRDEDLLDKPATVHEPETPVAMTPSPYLPTPKAARYLGHSESWLLRRGDIAYLPGRPNMYAVRDLDDWFERNKHKPLS